MKSLKVLSVSFLTLFFVLFSNAQTNKKLNKNERAESKEDAAKNSNKIEDEDCPESGVARLRVTFDKSGIVTKAKIVLSAGCKFFDKQALEAAKKNKIRSGEKRR